MAPTAATIYIPTLTGGESLAACLEALADQTVPAQTVVADNGPGEGCETLLSSRFPAVERVAFGGRNLGFGTALNRAVATCGEGPVIFLNDDAVPEPGFVEELLTVRDESKAGMVAGVLLRADSPNRIDSAGIACDQTLTAWDYLTGEPVSALAGADDPFGPTGGAALFDREVFQEVGGFDERIFLYYEDLDLALKLRIAGHGCRLAPAARAVHQGSATLGRKAPAKYFQTGFSRAYLLRKYGVMRDPRLATKVVVSDSTAAIAQGMLDRTLAGTKGRLAGWRAGREAGRNDPPIESLQPARLGRHFGARMRRRRR